jgi:hypothetical protein
MACWGVGDAVGGSVGVAAGAVFVATTVSVAWPASGVTGNVAGAERFSGGAAFSEPVIDGLLVIGSSEGVLRGPDRGDWKTSGTCAVGGRPVGADTWAGGRGVTVAVGGSGVSVGGSGIGVLVGRGVLVYLRVAVGRGVQVGVTVSQS